MKSPRPEPHHRGWSLFFGTCISLVGGWILRLSAIKHPEGERLGAVLIGAGLLLVGLWLIFAAISGRMPEWLQDLIDDPD